MKKVRIKKLTLVNFKGARNTVVEFSASVTQINGANATGKTTLLDAFTWLLFGKDSSDKKDFGIKTLDANNKVIEKIDHEVEGVLSIDGKDVVLKRTYREKWVTRRGSAEPEMSGHETLFFVNDAPLQANEYQERVNKIMDESLFKLVTNPHYFANLPWQKRRLILVDAVGNVSDSVIAGSRQDFIDLLNDADGMELDEYKKQVAAKKKKLRGLIEAIPARIDEQERTKPEAKDWKQIEEEIDNLGKSIIEIEHQIEDESKKYQDYYKSKADHQKAIGDIKLKVSDREFEARKLFQDQLNKKQEGINQIKLEIRTIQAEMDNSQRQAENQKKYKADLEAKINSLREKWIKINAETLVIDESESYCPTCKQSLPDSEIYEKREAMVQNFNEAKKKKLDEINKEGLSLSTQLKSLSDEQDLVDYPAMIAQANERLTIASQYEIVGVSVILSEDSEYLRLKEQLSALEAKEVSEVNPTDNRDLKLRRSGYVDRQNILKSDLAKRDTIETANKRIEELLRQEKEYAQQLADLEGIEFLLQEFTRAKVDYLENKINSMFQNVRFKMFDVQINGGLVECCDVLVNTNGAWVSWPDANNAGRINAGVDIINTLSSIYKTSAPIWIDNAESVNHINESNSQRIELYVTNDDTLKVS